MVVEDRGGVSTGATTQQRSISATALPKLTSRQLSRVRILRPDVAGPVASRDGRTGRRPNDHVALDCRAAEQSHL